LYLTAAAAAAAAQVSLVSDRDVVAARLVKGRLERTTLGQVAADISIAFKPGAAAAAAAGGSHHYRCDLESVGGWSACESACQEMAGQAVTVHSSNQRSS
jgi:hypothetical protein